MKLNTLFEGFSKQIYNQPNESSDDEMALSAANTKLLVKTENKKYRLLLDDSIVWKGHTLYRIQYKDEIRDEYDDTLAKKDDFGGYIESLDNLSEEGQCVVINKAKVWGNARVYEDAWVSGNAEVYDNAKIYENAEVFGNTQVYDNAQVYGDAKVYGGAEVYGHSQVYEDAEVYDNAHVYGHAQARGDAQVYDNAEVYGDAEVYGSYIDEKINSGQWGL